MNTAGTENMWPDRLLIALAAALVGFAVRAFYDGWKERRKAKRRDRQVLAALVRELSVLQGLVSSNRTIVNNELALMHETSGESMLLTPLTPLPTGAYDLVRSNPPAVLLEGRTLSELALAVANASHVNAIQEARQTWKSGSWSDLTTTLAKYDRTLLTALDNVERYVVPARAVAHAAAGDAYPSNDDPAKASTEARGIPASARTESAAEAT